MLLSAESMRTTLDVLLLNPCLCPPLNAAYGARTSGFVLSHVHRFGGKPWQLRSVRVRGQAYHIVPFVVNSGGSSWDTPIVGDATLARLGIARDESGVLDRAHDDVFELPNPVGRIRRPLVLEWDQRHTEEDVRMNLVGHELALMIATVDKFARCVKTGRLDRDAALVCLLDDDLCVDADRADLERELDALLAAPLPCEGLWTTDTLPLAAGALLG